MTAGYELDGDVAIVTLDRPDRYNAIDAAMCAAVVESLGRAGREARAVVLTGAGKAFCSGADLSDLQDEYETCTPDLSARLDDVFHPVVHAIAGCAVPTVAAVNGVAAGAGMGLALGCDLRVMAESAYFTSAFTARSRLTIEDLSTASGACPPSEAAPATSASASASSMSSS